MAKPIKKRPDHAQRAKKGNVTPLKSKRDQGFEIDFEPIKQSKQRRRTAATEAKITPANAGPEVLTRLWTIIESRRNANPEISHSARLLGRGVQRIAQKLGEEAVECLVEVTTGNRLGVISESADVLYHLLVAWVSAGISPDEVWRELAQRERVSRLSGGDEMSVDRLVGSLQIGTTKIP